MQYVNIRVDGIKYMLKQQPNGSWMVTNQAPYVAGEYPITVTAVTEQGQEIEIDVESGSELSKALTLIVQEGGTISGERMIKYYPQIISDIEEIQAILKTEGFEIDIINSSLEFVINDAYLLTMSERRIAQWEKMLGIPSDPTESVEDRRDTIIGKIRGNKKLNTEVISNIVNAFTGGDALSYIQDSVLYVKITPPRNNKTYKFENVERELMNRKPAHLGLTVTRNYATWGEIKENFASWNAIKQLDSWEDLMVYIAP